MSGAMYLIQGAPTHDALLHRALRRYPERDAFCWDGQVLSYRAIEDLIGRMQAVFARDGLQRGDRCALLTANNPLGWCAGQAALASGLAITWLHPMGSLADHLFQLADFEVSVLVVDGERYADRGRDLAAGHEGLRVRYALSDTDFAQDLLGESERVGTSAMRALAAPADLAAVLYTGGTTGRSKGAIRDQVTYAAMSTSIVADYDLPSRPRFLAVAPISHVSGTLVLPCLLRGGTVHLMPGFDPDRVLDTLSRERINLGLLVPTMIYGMLDHPRLAQSDLSALEMLLYGASPMSPARLIEGMERLGPVFSQMYGLTEAYPMTILRREDHDRADPDRLRSCGVPISSMSVSILDEGGRQVAPGEVGELCARGANVMQGYLNQPEETAHAMRDGWLHSGDMAMADDRGFLYIVDRKKDMVVSGGFNVYPREIEDVISTVDGVSMVAVIGVPDPKWGEAVMALVQRRPGADVDADAVIRVVKQLKGSVHAPKRVEFVDAMPLTAVGKIDKKVLRARFWAEEQRQVS